MRIDQSMIKKLMGQLKMEEVPAEEVIIKCSDKDIIIKNPVVQRLRVQGKDSFQVSGEVVEQETIEVSEDDVKLVMDKTGCSEDEALNALAESNGDIAGAILLLSN